MTRTGCPELPCPGDPAFTVTFEEEGGSGSTGTRVFLIVIIIVLLLALLLLGVILGNRKLRERCFRKFGPRTSVRYIDLEGSEYKSSPEPVKRGDWLETHYNRDLEKHLELDLQIAPDIPGIVEYEPKHHEPVHKPKVKVRPRKAKGGKAKASPKDSFADVDTLNALSDKGKEDNENLVEINADELLQKHKEAMRRELRENRNRKNARGSRYQNEAFTNDITDPEAMENALNELQSRGQTPDLLPIRDVPDVASVGPDTLTVPTARHRKHRHIYGQHTSGHHSDASRAADENHDDSSSSRENNRRKKNRKKGDSMRSTSSSKSDRKHRRRHGHRGNHGDTDAGPDALLMTHSDPTDFTNMAPIDEHAGSLV